MSKRVNKVPNGIIPNVEKVNGERVTEVYFSGLNENVITLAKSPCRRKSIVTAKRKLLKAFDRLEVLGEI